MTYNGVVMVAATQQLVTTLEVLVVMGELAWRVLFVVCMLVVVALIILVVAAAFRDTVPTNCAVLFVVAYFAVFLSCRSLDGVGLL